MNNLKVINGRMPPNKDLIELLTQLLEKAKNGELMFFSGVGQYNNEDMCNVQSYGKGMKATQMIGSLLIAINAIDRAYGLTDDIVKVLDV